MTIRIPTKHIVGRSVAVVDITPEIAAQIVALAKTCDHVQARDADGPVPPAYQSRIFRDDLVVPIFKDERIGQMSKTDYAAEEAATFSYGGPVPHGESRTEYVFIRNEKTNKVFRIEYAFHKGVIARNARTLDCRGRILQQAFDEAKAAGVCTDADFKEFARCYTEIFHPRQIDVLTRQRDAYKEALTKMLGFDPADAVALRQAHVEMTAMLVGQDDQRGRDCLEAAEILLRAIPGTETWLRASSESQP